MPTPLALRSGDPSMHRWHAAGLRATFHGHRGVGGSAARLRMGRFNCDGHRKPWGVDPGWKPMHVEATGCEAYHARDTISGAPDGYNPLRVACFSLLTSVDECPPQLTSIALPARCACSPHAPRHENPPRAPALVLRANSRCDARQSCGANGRRARDQRSACASRAQSKPLPGSCFRVGATCSCPTTASIA